MKKLFTSLDIDAFTNKSAVDISHVAEKLPPIMTNMCINEMLKKPKLRTFCLYKDDASTEDYVMKLMCRRERSLFAQFRHGILPLKVETGRFKNIPVHNRICELCAQDVEDEMHFLCKCETYSDLRTSLYDEIASYHHQFLGFSLQVKGQI